MKYKILFISAVLFSVPAFSLEKLPVIHIYAYSQAITQGKDPGKGIINENGSEEKENAKPGIHYLIYVEQAGLPAIKPQQIWISGICYSIKSIAITNTPIGLEDQAVYGESKKTILVAETSNKVIQLIINGISPVPIKSSPSLKKLIASSDLVVSYLWKGKKYYRGIKKIKLLEPIASV